MTGVKFLFRVTLRRHDLVAEIFSLREPVKVPLVLSKKEIKRSLIMAPSLKARVMLSLAYGCGLRAGEVVRLQVGDIDSAQEIIRIVQAKGRKDRNVMLPTDILDLLRESEKFRIDIRRDECRDWCHQQQFYGWQHQYKEEHVTPDLEPEGVEGDAWRAPLPDLSGFDHARYEAYLKETLGGSPTWFFSQETLGDDRVRAALVAAEGGDAAGAGA